MYTYVDELKNSARIGSCFLLTAAKKTTTLTMGDRGTSISGNALFPMKVDFMPIQMAVN